MTDRDLLEEIRTLLVRLVGRAGASALPRKEAAHRMGIGVTRLRELIASGEVATCAGSPRLVPVSEIERWTAPRAGRGSASTRRRRPGRRSRKSDRKSEADRIRDLERVEPDLPEGDH